MDRVAVRFTRSSPPYHVGEVAGFSPDVAERLIKKAKVAVLWDGKNPDPTPPKSPEKRIVVRFLKSAPPYHEGEIAGFSEPHANHLRENGIAEFVEDATKAIADPAKNKAILSAPQSKGR